MEDLVYRYSGIKTSQSKCIDIAQASTDPEHPLISIAIGDRSVLLDGATAIELAMRLSEIAHPQPSAPY